ncbi:MG(2+) CHELATASE FAMILY PROTEIN / ComM-related protein, partial [hydrothermal vent metagenome]
RVDRARCRQMQRAVLNAQLSLDDIQIHCELGTRLEALIEKAVNHFRLSPRGVHRILKVARTIADLADSERILELHLQEAIGYRCLEACQT